MIDRKIFIAAVDKIPPRPRKRVEFGGGEAHRFDFETTFDALVDRPLSRVPHPYFVGRACRPAVTLPMSPGRHRWEWMLHPGEDAAPHLEPGAVRRAVEEWLDGERAEIERARCKPNSNLVAYDYYLRALAEFHKRTREGTDRALLLLEKAMSRDAEFASACGLAALCYQKRKANGWVVDPERETAEAKRLARRAADIGKNDADALSWSALTLAFLAGDIEVAASLIERSLKLNPNSATAWTCDTWINGCNWEPVLSSSVREPET